MSAEGCVDVRWSCAEEAVRSILRARGLFFVRRCGVCDVSKAKRDSREGVIVAGVGLAEGRSDDIHREEIFVSVEYEAERGSDDGRPMSEVWLLESGSEDSYGEDEEDADDVSARGGARVRGRVKVGERVGS